MLWKINFHLNNFLQLFSNEKILLIMQNKIFLHKNILKSILHYCVIFNNFLIVFNCIYNQNRVR
jgi:hypothetical protein